VPACAGLTVAPTVTALTVSAAEMAIKVRFNEDPDMVILPLRSAFGGSWSTLFKECAKGGKLRFQDLPTSKAGRGFTKFGRIFLKRR
jgi:hypothetical protein